MFVKIADLCNILRQQLLPFVCFILSYRSAFADRTGQEKRLALLMSDVGRQKMKEVAQNAVACHIPQQVSQETDHR